MYVMIQLVIGELGVPSKSDANVKHVKGSPEFLARNAKYHSVFMQNRIAFTNFTVRENEEFSITVKFE